MPKSLKTNTAVCIVAAGTSKRMGEPKQLLRWGRHTLIAHAITHACKVSKHVFVVLGAHYDKIMPTITGAQIIHNRDWELGMGSSIAKGIHHITEVDSFSHILIMLVDQPYLDAEYLNTMLDLVEKKPFGIVATAYDNKFGVPAIFSTTYFEELKQLNQDFGARKLLKKYRDDIVGVSPGNKTIDIDTPEAYSQLKPKT